MSKKKILFAAVITCLLVSTSVLAEPFVNPPEQHAPSWVTPFPYQRNINYYLTSPYPTVPIYEGTDDPVLLPSDYYEIIGDEIIQDPVNGIGYDNTGGGFVRYGTVVFHIDN